MASVHRRKNSPYWWAKIKAPSGEWIAQSTKEVNKAKALRLAFELEGAGGTLKTDNPTAAQLDRVVRGMWERYTGARISLNRADEYLRSWVANMKRKPGTVERYRQITDEFLESLGDRAAFDLKAIETSDVQKFVNRDIALGRSGTTVTLNAKILRAVFNAAIRDGHLEKNPASSLALPDAIAEEREPFTPGEVETLLKASAKTDWCTAIQLAAYAGLRLGDAVTLKWSSVDLAKGVLEFIPQKTSRKGKKLVMPIGDRLLAYLTKLASDDAAQRSEYVCPTLAMRDIGGRKGLSAEFVGLMSKANVGTNVITATDGRIRKFNRKSFHSLRHVFVSRMANAGIANDVRASLAGHADPKETGRYSHLGMDIRRKAVNAGHAENEK
jgi:integrase